MLYTKPYVHVRLYLKWKVTFEQIRFEVVGYTLEAKVNFPSQNGMKYR